MSKFFYVFTDSISCAQNTIFLALLNTVATQKVWLHQLHLVPTGTGSLTGVACEFDLLRITAITAGTAVTPVPIDARDAAPASLTCVKSPTAVTGSTVFFTLWTHNDEYPITGEYTGGPGNILPVPILLSDDQGVALKQITASTVGSFSITAIVSVEPV